MLKPDKVGAGTYGHPVEVSLRVDNHFWHFKSHSFQVKIAFLTGLRHDFQLGLNHPGELVRRHGGRRVERRTQGQRSGGRRCGSG